MAAAPHVNIAPPEQKVSLAIVKPSPWQPHSIAMHVTRPKSAKGRTRPSLNYSHSVEAYSSRVPLSPQPLSPCEDSAGGQRASSSQQLYQPLPASPAEIPDLLQQVPTRSSSSLNKYRVLPSISRKDLRKSTVDVMSEQAGQLQVSTKLKKEDQGLRGFSLGKTPTRLATQADSGYGESAQIPPLPSVTKPSCQISKGVTPASVRNLAEPSESEPRLLLAIRSPSGHRFECHFRPTDSLETVLAVAEQRNSAAYDSCSIETVEVPRRTFSDLTKSLQDCAIPHKSVLCILQEERGEF